MNRLPITLLLLVVGFAGFVLFLVGCPMPAATTANVAGKYKSTYANGADTVEIRPDGTYTQSTQIDGVVHSHSSSWRIERAKSGYDFIYFSQFARTFELPRVQPGNLLTRPGMWLSHQGREWIVFEDEPNYSIIKTKGGDPIGNGTAR